MGEYKFWLVISAIYVSNVLNDWASVVLGGAALLVAIVVTVIEE